MPASCAGCGASRTTPTARWAPTGYPPFALAATDHPASLEIAYPQRLSRSLVLVKWLLPLPHLLLVPGLAGSAGTLGLPRLAPVPPLVGGGLIGLLVLIAAGHLALVG